MSEDEEESLLTTLRDKESNRSDFDRAFEEDTLHQLQSRMHAKAKTKKFSVEQFVEKARADYEEDMVVEETTAPTDPTPEPEEEEPFTFF